MFKMQLFGGIYIPFFVALLVVFSSGWILFFKRKYNYWKNRNIPTVREPVIPFGNMVPLLIKKRTFGQLLADLYNEAKQKGYKYAGVYMFHKTVMIAVDPEFIKTITTKDFQYFTSRGSYCNEEHEPLTGNVANLNGERWKNMRAKLTPTFTSGKMKMMFQTLVQCSEELESLLNEYCKKNETFDIKDTMGRFTTDIIGSCAFGIDCNSLKDPNSIFRQHGKSIFENHANSIMEMFSSNFPKLFVALGLKRIPQKQSDFFMNLVKDTVDYREKNNYIRKDFMQLLIDMKAKDGEANREETIGTPLSMNEIAAQSFVFFLAGFETSSATLSSIMYELATHQDVQNKLREEIREVLKKYEEKITYEAILDMNYMDKVIDESMRLHSAATLTARICTEDYKLPDRDLILEKGTRIFIPIHGLHYDPEFYKDPEKFDPEHFSAEEKANRHPCVFLPFGTGPRNCIGLRFAMLQMKVGLVALLKNYKFTLNPKTITPIQLDPNSNLYTIKGGVWLNCTRIQS